ncbi:MAG: DUF6311 domain-containing protein, partial [Oscillospiraceae bacterium]|nr:DUF6311 domain-containing protein [Oscillospiraceae bacterium]
MMNLDANKRKIQNFVLGLGLGAAVFLLIFGLKALDFTDDSWIRGGYIEQDIIQHYVGWLSYREAPLSFPFCITQQLNYPAGISAAYTDSIPLFCVIFRFIEPLLPETFQFFGLFTLLSFMLQGGASALLLSLFCEGRAKPLLGALLFTINPVLLERAFRHTALTAQFLIVLALYLYFDARRKNALISSLYIALCALAATIHAYFV